MGYLGRRLPLHKGDVCTPTSASLWTAPVGPALPVRGALSDPTAVPFWLGVFDPERSNPQPEGQASCSEEGAGSTLCNHI